MTMIQIYENTELVGRAAAELFVRTAQSAVQEYGRFLVVLSGGHTLLQTYALLAQPPYRDEVPWRQVYVFWADEQCVPPENSDSNQRMVREHLLNFAPVPPNHIYPIPYEATPLQSAEVYETFLHQFFDQFLTDQEPYFDLVYLGLGEDGHTASLFPDSSALHINNRWITDVYLIEEGLSRITMTLPLLNTARRVCFLVTGENKAEALHETLAGPQDADSQYLWPAQLIQPVDGEVIWMVDRQAAKDLRQADIQEETYGPFQGIIS